MLTASTPALDLLEVHIDSDPRGRVSPAFPINRFTGAADEITVTADHTVEPAEFAEWRWRPLAELPAVAPLHRRQQYARVLEAFGHIGPA